ncbi:MAG TPA: hypothetical protein VH186_29060 [Chloroflexia bacterium]|nr:hypothetical protein [Chloroflexia bacterium]
MQTLLPGNSTTDHSPVTRPKEGRPWLWLILFVFIIGLYFVLRFDGRWSETDSAAFTNLSQVFIHDGRLEPVSGEAYPHGYGYQAISAFLVSVTGLDVSTFQQILFPLLACLVVIPAWVMYRELIGNARGATIACTLLFIQPEFLFVILRSSHEKFSRTFMILCLFALIRSFKLRGNVRQFAVYVFLFYLSAFALIATNNLLSHSFIFALALALLLGWLGSRWKKNLRIQNNIIFIRFTYATIICLGLVFVFTFYFYNPAKLDFVLIKSIGDKIASLFLDVQKPTSSSYTYVAEAWVSYGVYLLISIANWTLLAGSVIIWAVQGFRWFILGKTPASEWDWIIWILYTAFSIQGAFSMVADTSGAFDNLQYRMFPSFSLFAIALVSTYLSRFRPRKFARSFQLAFTACIFCISILSVLKATNEPLLSNKWTFYRPAEISIIDWSVAYQPNSYVWTEFDERLITAYLTEKNLPASNKLIAFDYEPSTRDAIATTISRLRSIRQQRALPIPPDAMQVYDNGEAQFYHYRPLTPFQR